MNMQRVITREDVVDCLLSQFVSQYQRVLLVFSISVTLLDVGGFLKRTAIMRGHTGAYRGYADAYRGHAGGRGYRC